MVMPNTRKIVAIVAALSLAFLQSAPASFASPTNTNEPVGTVSAPGVAPSTVTTPAKKPPAKGLPIRDQSLADSPALTAADSTAVIQPFAITISTSPEAALTNPSEMTGNFSVAVDEGRNATVTLNGNTYTGTLNTNNSIDISIPATASETAHTLSLGFTNDGGALTLDSLTQATTDSVGRTSTFTSVFTINSTGETVVQTSTCMNTAPGDSYWSSRTDYTYDEQGRILSAIKNEGSGDPRFDQTWTHVSNTYYAYGPAGEITTVTTDATNENGPYGQKTSYASWYTITDRANNRETSATEYGVDLSGLIHDGSGFALVDDHALRRETSYFTDSTLSKHAYQIEEVRQEDAHGHPGFVAREMEMSHADDGRVFILAPDLTGTRTPSAEDPTNILIRPDNWPAFTVGSRVYYASYGQQYQYDMKGGAIPNGYGLGFGSSEWDSAKQAWTVERAVVNYPDENIVGLKDDHGVTNYFTVKIDAEGNLTLEEFQPASISASTYPGGVANLTVNIDAHGTAAVNLDGSTLTGTFDPRTGLIEISTPVPGTASPRLLTLKVEKVDGAWRLIRLNDKTPNASGLNDTTYTFSTDLLSGHTTQTVSSIDHLQYSSGNVLIFRDYTAYDPDGQIIMANSFVTYYQLDWNNLGLPTPEVPNDAIVPSATLQLYDNAGKLFREVQLAGTQILSMTFHGDFSPSLLPATIKVLKPDGSLFSTLRYDTQVNLIDLFWELPAAPQGIVTALNGSLSPVFKITGIPQTDGSYKISIESKMPPTTPAIPGLHLLSFNVDANGTLIAGSLAAVYNGITETIDAQLLYDASQVLADGSQETPPAGEEWRVAIAPIVNMVEGAVNRVDETPAHPVYAIYGQPPFGPQYKCYRVNGNLAISTEAHNTANGQTTVTTLIYDPSGTPVAHTEAVNGVITVNECYVNGVATNVVVDIPADPAVDPNWRNGDSINDAIGTLPEPPPTKTDAELNAEGDQNYQAVASLPSNAFWTAAMKAAINETYRMQARLIYAQGQFAYWATLADTTEEGSATHLNAQDQAETYLSQMNYEKQNIEAANEVFWVNPPPGAPGGGGAIINPDTGLPFNPGDHIHPRLYYIQWLQQWKAKLDIKYNDPQGNWDKFVQNWVDKAHALGLPDPDPSPQDNPNYPADVPDNYPFYSHYPLFQQAIDKDYAAFLHYKTFVDELEQALDIRLNAGDRTHGIWLHNDHSFFGGPWFHSDLDDDSPASLAEQETVDKAALEHENKAKQEFTDAQHDSMASVCALNAFMGTPCFP